MIRNPNCPPTANPKVKYCNVYITKGGGYNLYKWSPPPNQIKQKKAGAFKPFYCAARAYTDGQDWVSTYSYDMYILNGQQARSPYVECDYVM
jgi:hypothetical protein